MSRESLLMQYNDNIPALFGFPPSSLSEERRTPPWGEGGENRRRGDWEQTVLGSNLLFVCLSIFPLLVLPLVSLSASLLSGNPAMEPKTYLKRVS